jgi:hypothetical protein
MELPADVLIHNEILGIKGGKGVLLRISDAGGYYEVNCRFGDRLHRAYFPVSGTVLIAQEPEPTLPPGVEIER